MTVGYQPTTGIKLKDVCLGTSGFVASQGNFVASQGNFAGKRREEPRSPAKGCKLQGYGRGAGTNQQSNPPCLYSVVSVTLSSRQNCISLAALCASPGHWLLLALLIYNWSQKDSNSHDCDCNYW